MRSFSFRVACTDQLRMWQITLSGVVFLFVLVSLSVPGWAQDEEELQTSFDSLLTQHAESPAAQRAQALADWMESNEWKKLYLRRRVNLMVGLAQRGQWDRQAAVRWNGFIAAPASGTYHFQQLHNPYAVGDFRLWIGNQLVLDSRPEEAEQLGTESRYRSLPVSLIADQPVELRAEFVRTPDVLQPQLIGYFHNVQPVVALMWESEQLSQRLVAPDAYTPPEGFEPDSEQTTGLKAEFFSDPLFQQPLFIRRDTGVELTTRVAVTVDHWDSFSAARNRSFRKFSNPDFESKISGVAAAGFWEHKSIPVFTEYATIWQRAQLVDWMIEHPEVLSAASNELFGKFFSKVAMLPGERRLQLIRGWAEDREPQPAQVRFYPDLYEENIVNHRRIGRWLQGPFAGDLEELVNNDLAHSDGHCRIDLVAAIAHGALQGGQGGWLREQLNSRLADQSATGDARASWLVGMALVEEALAGVPARPQQAFPYLTEALLVAETDPMRFQVLGQYVPRMLSLGKFSEGRALLNQWSSQFQSLEQQQVIAQWRMDADDLEINLEDHIARRSETLAEQSRVKRVALLQQRLERAQQRGDAALAARYQNMIQQSAPPED